MARARRARAARSPLRAGTRVRAQLPGSLTPTRAVPTTTAPAVSTAAAWLESATGMSLHIS